MGITIVISWMNKMKFKHAKATWLVSPRLFTAKLQLDLNSWFQSWDTRRNVLSAKGDQDDLNGLAESG